MKDEVVAPVLEQFGPRGDSQYVAGQAAIRSSVAGSCDVAIEAARGAGVLLVELNSDHLAHKVFELDVGVIADQLECLVKGGVELFLRIKILQKHLGLGSIVVGKHKLHQPAGLA